MDESLKDEKRATLKASAVNALRNQRDELQKSHYIRRYHERGINRYWLLATDC